MCTNKFRCDIKNSHTESHLSQIDHYLCYLLILVLPWSEMIKKQNLKQKIIFD